MTNEEIDKLISVEKIIVEPPKREFLKEGSYKRNDFKAVSVISER